MSDQRRQRRGRPKGSGINDWERLLQIAALMEGNPELRATTAIKELGFDDPSTIRRLRDKFKVNRAALLRPSKTNAGGSYAESLIVATTPAKRRYTDMCPPSPRCVPPEKGGRDTHKQRHFKRAQDALAEYAHLADRPNSFVSGFQASIAHCLLRTPQDYGVER